MLTAAYVYHRSHGGETRRYYAMLRNLGPYGHIGVALLQAMKASSHAKRYHGNGGRGLPSSRTLAYKRKQWALGQLTSILARHALMPYGWGEDTGALHRNRWVLYVDLCYQEEHFGQVSFHSPERGIGPDYPQGWDGKAGSELRILDYCARLDRCLAVQYPVLMEG